MATIHATYNGIGFDVDEDALSSWDALEAITDMQAGGTEAVSAAVRFSRILFGRDQFAAIKRQLPDNTLQTVMAFLSGAMEALAQAKGENPKN